jgi:hypothetical protein
MRDPRRTEVIVKVNDLRDLFREREFDPFTDDIDAVSSIAKMAQLPHLASKLKTLELRVLAPPEQITPHTEARVQSALRRYCAHMVTEARRKLTAMRWVGLRALAIGLGFFAISLAGSAAVQRIASLPEEIRTLASESLIIAGWVLMWQPLDTLVSGWWPQWQEERTFKAISAIPITVQASDSIAPT